MAEDTILSKKLSEFEEKKKHYLARRVESSDREKVEGVSLEPKGEKGVSTSVHGVDLPPAFVHEAGTSVEEAVHAPTCETEEDPSPDPNLSWVECVKVMGRAARRSSQSHGF